MATTTDQQSIHFRLISQALAVHQAARPGLSSIEHAPAALAQAWSALLKMEEKELHSLFVDWAGLEPEQCLACLQPEYIRNCATPTIQQAKLPSRLFVQFEVASDPRQVKKSEPIEVEFGLAQSPFGLAFAARTPVGLLRLEFETEQLNLALWLNNLKQLFPNARFLENRQWASEFMSRLFDIKSSAQQKITVHAFGTPFQIEVWNKLLQIPLGQLTTYGHIAKQLNKPSASRAVGSAIASNPIGFLVPCHRVIQARGELGQYRWNAIRKKAMYVWEQGQLYNLPLPMQPNLKRNVF